MKKQKQKQTAVMDAPAPAPKVYTSEPLEETTKGGKLVKYTLNLIGWAYVKLAEFIANFAVASLKPNPNNPRGPKPNTSDMHGAITRPLLIAHDGRIIQGHRRYAHARAIGLETVPVLRLPKDTPEDAIIELAADHGGEKGLRRIELARSISFLTGQGHSEKKVFTLLREALNELNPIDPRDPADEYKRHRGFIQQVGRLDELRKSGHAVIADEYEKNWSGKTGSLVTARDLTASTAENGKEDKAQVIASLTEKITNPPPAEEPETDEQKKNRIIVERTARHLADAWLHLVVVADDDAGKVARAMLKEVTRQEIKNQKSMAAKALAHVLAIAYAPLQEESKKAKAKTAKK